MVAAVKEVEQTLTTPQRPLHIVTVGARRMPIRNNHLSLILSLYRNQLHSQSALLVEVAEQADGESDVSTTWQY